MAEILLRRGPEQSFTGSTLCCYKDDLCSSDWQELLWGTYLLQWGNALNPSQSLPTLSWQKAVRLWMTFLHWLEGMVTKMQSLRDMGRREGQAKSNKKLSLNKYRLYVAEYIWQSCKIVQRFSLSLKKCLCKYIFTLIPNKICFPFDV